MKVSCSSNLSHPYEYRAEDYSYSPIEGMKHGYGKATQNYFKPRELTKELLLTPDLAFSMATFKPNIKQNKKGKDYKAFSRSDDNIAKLQNKDYFEQLASCLH